MFRNYLVTALRNIRRYRLYSFINIAGLAVGLACVILIALFVRDEISFDDWVPDSQNLYRVESLFHMPGRDPDFFPGTPFPVAPTMQQEIPEVVAYTHLIPENATAQVGDRQFPVTVDAVDPNFFQLIKLPFLKGNAASALAQPESVVLSESAARKFFGSPDAVGKTLMLNGDQPLIVTAILRDIPHNSHLAIEMVIPNSSKADSLALPARDAWLNNPGFAYVKLVPGADMARVQAKLAAMIDRHIDVKKQMTLNIPGRAILHLHLTPFRSIHLAPFGETKDGRETTLYGFGAIAALIMLIATINYMNLATARGILRAREVSLRKVMGAKRSQLFAQFVGESVLMALAGLLLALAIVEILLPSFDSFLSRPISFHILADWPLTLASLGAAVLAGLLGGSYPALVLSRYRPAAALGTSVKGLGGSVTLRSVLVVLQFAISIGLGIVVMVIFAQIDYSRQLDLGFDRHNLLIVDGSGKLTASARDSLAKTLAADPAIQGVAQSGMVPFDGRVGIMDVELPGSPTKFVVRGVGIDPDFIQVYGMKLLAGRNLSRDRATDVMNAPPGNGSPAANVLVNATAARRFGFTPAGAIGHTVSNMTIVGVVDDANFDGMQNAMQPFVYFYNPNALGLISVRIKPGKTAAAVAAVDSAWHRFMPGSAIRRRFEDASFDKLFSSDQQTGEIFSIFVAIAIFISCLGLFGLAAFTAGRRTREIGIRKVFGARARDLVFLLLWQFSIPVLIANLIAWPIAWYYLRGWLQGFAYRIALSPLYFAAAGLAALLIAWATILAHALRVARANPVHALRYE